MTDDVYVRKLSLRPGWVKVGHSEDVEHRYNEGDEPGVIVAVWPGGGRELEQWLHAELGQVYERDGRTERFRCDVKAVELAVSIGSRNGIVFVARAALARKSRDLENRLIAEKAAERQKALAAREAGISYSRETTEKARKAAQAPFTPKLLPFPRVVERGKQHGEHTQRRSDPDRDVVPDAE